MARPYATRGRTGLTLTEVRSRTVDPVREQPAQAALKTTNDYQRK